MSQPSPGKSVQRQRSTKRAQNYCNGTKQYCGILLWTCWPWERKAASALAEKAAKLLAEWTLDIGGHWHWAHGGKEGGQVEAAAGSGPCWRRLAALGANWEWDPRPSTPSANADRRRRWRAQFGGAIFWLPIWAAAAADSAAPLSTHTSLTHKSASTFLVKLLQ